jgi:hypothetical protein
MLDTAVGILVGLRRCSIDAAFQELITAAAGQDVPVFTIASALIAFAGPDGRPHADDTAAGLAAHREWGHLLGQTPSQRRRSRARGSGNRGGWNGLAGRTCRTLPAPEVCAPQRWSAASRGRRKSGVLTDRVRAVNGGCVAPPTDGKTGVR